MTATPKTEPRPYSSEWRDAEPAIVETQYGPVRLTPLGWGIRAETPNYSALMRYAPEPLRVNGGSVILSSADFHETAPGVWTCENLESGYLGPLDGATPKQRAKVAAILPGIVAEWASANRAEVDRRAAAWRSERARTCEESIRELEDALEDYRARLAAIEAGDVTVSPYLNGGRGIDR